MQRSHWVNIYCFLFQLQLFMNHGSRESGATWSFFHFLWTWKWNTEHIRSQLGLRQQFCAWCVSVLFRCFSCIQPLPYYFVNPEDDSPYPEVRSAVANFDDPEMPASTVRAWILGISWAVLLSGMNQFFYFRYPSVAIGIVRAKMSLWKKK